MRLKMFVKVLFVFICLYGKNGISQTRLTAGLRYFNKIVSNDKISFTVDSDDAGNLHLVYLANQTAFFVKFNPKQKVPISSIKLPVTPGNSPHKRFYLITKDGQDYFFWWQKGLNRLKMNSSGRTLKTEVGKMLPSIPLSDFTVTDEADILWLIYSNQKGIYLRKSLDMGLKWSDVIGVYSFSEGETITSVPVMNLHKNAIYLSFSVLFKEARRDKKVIRSPKIMILKATDAGEHWVQSFKLKPKHQGSAVIRNLKIFGWQNTLHLFYSERGIYHQHTVKSGSDFTNPERMTKTAPSLFKAYASEEGYYLLWVDTRYRQKEWWSHIPLHQMFTWDKDPYWANNDLFLSCHSKKKSEVFVLTPQNSYTIPSINSVKLLELDSDIIILWSGLREVGKTLKDKSVPYSIFYRVVPKNKLFIKYNKKENSL